MIIDIRSGIPNTTDAASREISLNDKGTPRNPDVMKNLRGDMLLCGKTSNILDLQELAPLPQKDARCFIQFLKHMRVGDVFSLR